MSIQTRFVFVSLSVLSFLATLSAHADDPKPRGSRVVTLACAPAVSSEDGGMYYGGRSPEVRITRNNTLTEDESTTIPGVRSETAEILTFRGMSDEIDVVPAQPGRGRHLFTTADGTKILDYFSSNCMNSPIQVVVLAGDAVMSCTTVVADVTTGVDMRDCQPKK